MLPKMRAVAVIVFAFVTAVTAAAVTEDACSVLTPAQISAVVGTTVGAGEYVTPTFKRTCTWKATKPGGAVAFVTFYINQGPGAYDQGVSRPLPGIKIDSVSGVGDGAFFAVLPPNVGMIVKKGGTSFKVAVYGSASIDKKEAMEKALAQQAVGKF
jgi:hypothetical protein